MKEDKEKPAEIRFYNSLLFRVGLIILAALSLAVVVGAQDTYFLTMKEEERKVLASVADIAEMMTATSSPDTIDWMFDYWEEHGEEMDILSASDWEDRQAMDEYRISHAKALDLYVNKAAFMTPEDLEKMDGEELRKFAEAWYNSWNSLLQQLCKTDDLEAITVFSLEDDVATMYFMSTEEGSASFAPGSRTDFDRNNYPVVNRIMETGKPQDDADHIVSGYDGSEFFFAPSPLILNGKVRCILTATYSWGEVRSDLVRQIWQAGSRILFYMLFAVALLILLLHIHVLKPMRLLQSQLREYSEEKDSSKVLKALEKINRRKDEVGVLSCDVSSLTEEIDQYIRDITAYAEKKARVDAELSLATTIQANALPKSFPALPERKEFELHAFMNPALEVGGDFYDFFMIDDDHLALVIADVSDKGVPSALFMMLTQSMIETLSTSAWARRHPSELFGMINDRLKAKNSVSMFVTVWMGILTISTGELNCANAGHEYPAILRSGESEGFCLHKVPHSPPLGAFPGVPFLKEDLKLEKGDVLFVYTDGVTEAASPHEECFGEERLIGALNENAGKDPSGIIEGVQKAVLDFMGDNEQFDDITMLCIRYNGSV